MKKTITRVISLVCILALLMSFGPLSVFATSDSLYFPRYTGSSGSIVTGLSAVGAQSSFSYRERIAVANGIAGYRGTASQNIALLNLLKRGELRNPDGKADEKAACNDRYFPRYSGNSGSIVTGLSAVGAQSNFSYRQKIAVANGITGYRGSAAQNTQMLSLLKQGLLINPEGCQEQDASGVSTVTYYDTNVNTTLRAEPYEASKIVTKVNKGTTIAVFETVNNRYGNQWIKTRVNGAEGYIYIGKLISHEHRYNMSVRDGHLTASVCLCGSVRVYQNTQRLVSVLSIPATVDTFMSPGVWDAVSTLGSAITATGAAFAAAGPYAAAAVVVVFAGMALYAVIDIDGTVDEVYGKDTALERFKELDSDSEPYQLASTFTSSGSKVKNGIIILPGTTMTLDEATEVALYKTSSNFAGLSPVNLDPEVRAVLSLCRDYDIYTLNASDATILAKNFAQKGGYGYGNSKGLPVTEMDGLSQGKPKDGYYCHYHLFYFSSFGYNKVMHCFFGLPYPMTELVNGQCPVG